MEICRAGSDSIPKATPIGPTPAQHFYQSFFARFAEVAAPRADWLPDGETLKDFGLLYVK
jgi:hypothetical protein